MIRPTPRVAVVALLGTFTLLAASLVHGAENKANKSGVTVDWGSNNALPPLQPGKPQPPPSSLDPKYTAKGLTEGFGALMKKLGHRVRRVEVDDSEFPFLVHGVIDGRCSHIDMREALQFMPGYAYSGSTTLIFGDGTTAFVLNMTPSSVSSRPPTPADQQRRMQRMRALLDTATRRAR